MPELPEVQTVLNGLVKTLSHRKITGLDCFYPGTVIRDPAIREDPFPAKVVGTARRGKYIILNLERNHSLIIHLRMTGKLVHGRGSAGPSSHERACLLLSRDERLHFIDIRTFGKIILCRSDHVENYMPKLGVEPLSDMFAAAHLQQALAKRNGPIKNSLLDQSLVAGLGNIYVNEILFRSGIRPDRKSCFLQPKELTRLVKQTKQVLNEAIAKNGTSISDFRRIDDKSGEFQKFLQIYQKQQCPRGHEVVRIRQAGRSSFYCPVCQK